MTEIKRLEPKDKNKTVEFTSRKLWGWVVFILVVNLVVSGLVVGVGLTTYDSWGGWFERHVLGREIKDNEVVREQVGNQEQGNQSGRVETPAINQGVADIVEKVDPAVVSIIVSKDLPKVEQYYEEYNPFGDFFGDNFKFQIPRYRENGTEKREIGGGTGFVVESDGMIVTNRHVVEDEEADYTVLFNDESKYEARVLARDEVNDIAILKIDRDNLAVIQLGDSDKLRVGQAVIAIGNALGEFRNTVSMGIISGLQREITASSGYGQAEQLSGIIQTDAAINPGNSGGPLLNTVGEAIGVNVAVVSGSENIGFALPINEVKKVLASVKEFGRIVRPWIGVRYLMINDSVKEKNDLDYNYGALIVKGSTQEELAVVPGSPADKAGLVENDIILEFDGKKLEGKTTLSKAVLEHRVGENIQLKIYHKGEEKEVSLKLEERK